MGKLFEILASVASFMNALASIWTFLLMFLMTFDVLGRVLFNHPITGTAELVKLSIVGIVFMHTPHTFRVGRHVRSDLLFNRFGYRSKKAVSTVAYLLGSLIFLGIIVSSWSFTIEAWKILEYEGIGALRVPTYPIRTIIIISCAVTIAVFIEKILGKKYQHKDMAL